MRNGIYSYLELISYRKCLIIVVLTLFTKNVFYCKWLKFLFLSYCSLEFVLKCSSTFLIYEEKILQDVRTRNFLASLMFYVLTPIHFSPFRYGKMINLNVHLFMSMQTTIKEHFQHAIPFCRNISFVIRSSISLIQSSQLLGLSFVTIARKFCDLWYLPLALKVISQFKEQFYVKTNFLELFICTRLSLVTNFL